jgi:hypothetical protein
VGAGCPNVDVVLAGCEREEPKTEAFCSAGLAWPNRPDPVVVVEVFRLGNKEGLGACEVVDAALPKNDMFMV